MHDVVKLHGIPKSIVSNCDKVLPSLVLVEIVQAKWHLFVK